LKITFSPVLIVNILGSIEGDKKLAILSVFDLGKTIDSAIGNEGDKNTLILELIDEGGKVFEGKDLATTENNGFKAERIGVFNIGRVGRDEIENLLVAEDAGSLIGIAIFTI